MASRLFYFLCRLLILSFLLLQFIADTRAYSNVSLGSSLYAIDDNSSWASPSGDFAFGFRPFPGKDDQFLLAIWFAKIQDETIVWSANGNYPMPRESKLELTTTGQLVLTAPGGWELWKTDNLNSGVPSHAAMLDTGNFVIVTRNARSLWESFKNPTNSILPSQVLTIGDRLSSTINENDYRTGKFELRLLENGDLLLNQIDVFTTNPYEAYFVISNVSEVVFNESGYIQMKNTNGSITNLTPSFEMDRRDLYHRATLNFDGTFTQYSHQKTRNGNESWSAVTTIPANICLSIMGYFGSGPCGYNSFCELGSDARPSCGCPPGFSLLDSDNRYSGCKYEYSSLGQDCDQEGSIIQEDRFDFIKVDGADWPLAGYEQLYPSTVFECENSCLRDCYCAVAIFRPPNSTNSGTCWKKRLPLSNGRLDRTAVERSALFKVLKYNSSSQQLPNPNSGKEKHKQVTIILSVFLGTSLLFNFLSLAAILLSGFWLCNRNLESFCRILAARDLDHMNLHSFTYKELQEATDGFTEELGRGAFGTVYKGVLKVDSVRHVAVKKLDKVVQEGEKEFKTEVSVIGRTHHKNLVRLLGYCDEGQHRLLVYEFMHNGSLSSFLFGVMRPSWQQRVQIAFGIARGLMYLHEECSTQIIHCDIKPHNILLDDSFTAKISDFGLAKLLMNNQTRTLTGVRGTKGYVAPEWFRNTPVSVKIDVYSFGVMLLEIICCRRCVELEMEKAEILTDWAYECFSKGRVEELVKDDQEARGDLKKLEKMVMVALWCVNDEPQLRPSMRVITLMLEGILEVHVPPCPFPLSSMSLPSMPFPK